MKKRITVIVDEKLISRLKIDAINKATSVSNIVERLIVKYFEVNDGA